MRTDQMSDDLESSEEWDNSDCEWDSEFEGSLDSEEREILEDVDYLESVRDGRLTSDGNTWDDNLLDADIQAFFNKVLQAFHAVLNEISSTLQVLAVYWNSLEPLQMHEILPVLPCLIERINRSSIIERDIYEEPLATVLIPRLKFLYISGDNPRNLSFGKKVTRVAPNLAFLRFSLSHFRWVTSYLVSDTTQYSALNLAIPKAQNTISTSTKVL